MTSLRANNGGIQKTSIETILLFMVLLLMIALAADSWIGYRGYADDVMSIRGALLWQQETPYLGTTHWELRHPYILLMSVSTALGGLSDITVTLPSFLAVCVSLLLTWSLAAYLLPNTSPAIAALFFATLPITVISATTLVPGSLELSMDLGSRLLLFRAIRLNDSGRSQI